MKILKAGRPFFLLAGIILILMLLSSVVTHAAAQTVSIVVDGQKITTDAAPEIKNSRTFVPVATIVNSLGGASAWDSSTKQVTLTYGENTVVLTIGQTVATLNGAQKTLDAAPYIAVVDANGGGRTMVPLRFISESFGSRVDWDADTFTAVISSPGSSTSVTTKDIVSTKVETGKSYGSDKNSTYTIVTITGDKSLKASADAGIWLTSPVRYYIDFAMCGISGSDVGTKSVTASDSYVSSVRTGTQTGGIARVVIDMKEKVTPTAETYSSDGKVLTIVFKEKASTTGTDTSSKTDGSQTTNGSTSNGTENTTDTTTTPTLAANDTMTVQNTVKHDTASEYNPYADGKLVVCIDPGHGDTTGGKRSPDSSLLEWEFNRTVAYKLKSILEAKGVTVIMTLAQNATGDLSLADRCAVANDAGNVDLYVSIHGNANGSGKDWDSAHGWEIYCYKKGGVSEQAAKAIEAATKAEITEFSDRGVKTANFYVIKNTEMPAVLIEHGFYTNANECALMKTDAFRTRLAQADADGIMSFFANFK